MRPADQGTTQPVLPARSHARQSSWVGRIGGAMAAVATIGTLVGMAGVGHAMFDALAADGAAPGRRGWRRRWPHCSSRAW